MSSYSTVRKDHQQDMHAGCHMDAAIIEQGGKGGERTICTCDGWNAERIKAALALHDAYVKLSEGDRAAVKALIEEGARHGS